MSSEANYDVPIEEFDSEDEYEMMNEEDRKLYDIGEEIEHYENQKNTIEDGYMFIWDKTIIPYLRISIGNGILNKLSEGDANKFISYMLKSNITYKNTIYKLDTLKCQKQNMINNQNLTIPLSNVTQNNNKWKIIGKRPINKEQTLVKLKEIQIPIKKNIWNNTKNSSKILQEKWLFK